MPDNSLPKIFIRFSDVAEYEANKSRLSPNQFALITSIGKLLNQDINYSGVIQGIDQVPQIQFSSEIGAGSYYELQIKLFISQTVYRTAIIPTVTANTAGLVTPAQITTLNTLVSDVSDILTDISTIQLSISNIQADILDLQQRVSALEGGGA